MSDMVRWATRYIERFNFALTPLRGKVPYIEGWNLDDNLIWTAEQARGHLTEHPADNIGACLEPSKLVSLDADDPEGARAVLNAENIDLDGLMSVVPTTIGRAPRLEFAAPPGVELKRKALTWPAREEGEKPVTILEFRAGRVQDVLPPSIHPDTHQPYRWVTPPKNGFPVLPSPLIGLWLDFDNFKRRARNLCPWAPPEPEPLPSEPRATREFNSPSVIAAYNSVHSAPEILESHGYTRAGKNRWRSPNGHGMAGVVVLPNGKVFCHHTSDPLGDGYAHDAFDLFVHFDHIGDVRAATRAAAEMLGMRGNQR